MKKAKSRSGGKIRNGYTRSDFPAGLVRGKYAARLAAKSNVVRLKPEIAAAFPTSAAVNAALAAVLKKMKSERLPHRSTGRARDK
jgi:hypothetical protein